MSSVQVTLLVSKFLQNGTKSTNKNKTQDRLKLCDEFTIMTFVLNAYSHIFRKSKLQIDFSGPFCDSQISLANSFALQNH